MLLLYCTLLGNRGSGTGVDREFGDPRRLTARSASHDSTKPLPAMAARYSAILDEVLCGLAMVLCKS